MGETLSELEQLKELKSDLESRSDISIGDYDDYNKILGMGHKIIGLALEGNKYSKGTQTAIRECYEKCQTSVNELISGDYLMRPGQNPISKMKGVYMELLFQIDDMVEMIERDDNVIEFQKIQSG